MPTHRTSHDSASQGGSGGGNAQKDFEDEVRALPKQRGPLLK
jgi:hypothetical protein